MVRYFYYNRKEEVSGEELIEDGITVDAYRQKINPFLTYEIKYDDKRNKKQILSLEDTYVKSMYDAGQSIFNGKGLINYANQGYRLGFFDELSDCIPIVEEMIECFNKREDYEKSAYHIKEIKKLKKYINKINDGKSIAKNI